MATDGGVSAPELHSRGHPAPAKTASHSLHPVGSGSPSTSASTGPVWSDFGMTEHEDDGEWATVDSPPPLPNVLKFSPARTFSTHRIMKHIYSMPSTHPQNTILSIQRRAKDPTGIIECYSADHASNLINSHKFNPFPFELQQTHLISTPLPREIENWIQGGESIHVRIVIPRDKPRQELLFSLQNLASNLFGDMKI